MIACLDELTHLLKDLQVVEAGRLDELMEDLGADSGNTLSLDGLLRELVVAMKCCTQSEADHLLCVRPPELVRLLRVFELVPAALADTLPAAPGLLDLARWLLARARWTPDAVRRLFFATPERVLRDLQRHELLDARSLYDLRRHVRREAVTLPRLGKELLDRQLTLYQVQQLLIGPDQALVLGPYVLQRQLGCGGMGVVYRARHRLLQADRAVKIIRPDQLAHRSQFVALFRREIEVAARLRHPHIVQVLDGDEADGTLYMGMECLDGLNLEELVRRHGRLPWDRAVDCIVQAARGLEHVHRQNMVLRDVKPANLFLCLDGPFAEDTSLTDLLGLMTGVKIIDVGLAIQANAAESVAAPGERRVGTPAVVAPEQADHPDQLDIRADLYSLGVSFYFLLAGRYPFPGRTWEELVDQHRHAQPEPVERFCPELPAEVGRILDKLLAKHPDDRFADPAELIRALAPFTRTGGRRDTRAQAEPETTLCRTVKLDLPGAWLARPRFCPEARFEEAARTPGTLTFAPGLEYAFKLRGRVAADQLARALQALNGGACILTALELKIGHDGVNDDVLAAVGQLGALTQLCLRPSGAVSSAGLVRLDELTALRQLSLIGPACWRVQEPVLAGVLGRLSYLEELQLNDIPAGGETLRAVARLAGLEQLALQASQLLTDEDLSLLAPLKKLRRLDLSRCRNLTDQAMPHLCRLTGLEELRLTDTGLTGAGVEPLRRRLAGCRVAW